MDCRSEGADVARTMPSSADPARGRELFQQHCALCHGERGDGQGVRRQGVGHAANFTSGVWRSTATPDLVFRTIGEGKPGTSMPAFRSLSDEEVWDLTSWVLSLHAPNE